MPSLEPISLSPNDSPLNTHVEVAIIGAGWYGLASARTYLRLRPTTNLLILDSDTSVGGVWSSSRLYPNLVAQVKHGLFNYTDTPMPSSGSTNNKMVTGRMIHNYLQRYAEDHDLLRRIRFSTFVERVERNEDRNGEGWKLYLRGTEETVTCEKLLVATGVTSIPTFPKLDENDGSIEQLHSRDLGSKWSVLSSPKIQHVTVLGAAKSAYDAVYLLLSLGKRVTWVIRPNGAGPLAILPSEVLGVANSIAVASTRLMTYFSPSIFHTEGWGVGFMQRTWLGRKVVSGFWDFLDWVSGVHAGYGAGDHVAGLKPEIEGKSVFWANSGLGVVTLPDFWSTIHKGSIQILREEPKSISSGSIVFSSGKTLETDYIVSCTGWGDHFAMFSPKLKKEIGLPSIDEDDHALPDLSWSEEDIKASKSVDKKLPFLSHTPQTKNPHTHSTPQHTWRLYRRSIPLNLALKNDRSLAILGQIHTVQTPLVSEMQSFWTILWMLGEIDMPSEEEMRREVAEWNAWTRKRYLSQGVKHPYSLYEFLPYVETLCKDLGINSRRKSNPISELFSPYKPEDFNGFVDEYLEKRRREKESAGQV